MLSGGIWADYLRVNEIVSSVRLTSLRPRDYDLLRIERVVQNPPTPLHVLYCYLYSIECHLDRGEILEAREALEKADAASQTLESGITLEICTELVFLHAYLKRDAIATRSWWNRMEALTPNPTTWDYVLASVALQWIDGDLDEAEELWQKGNSAAEALPTAGGYDFDRYCFSLLRRALDESSAVSFKSREPEEDGANGFALQPG
jgi:tetratricopeptide (TPR) repeat protein